uniref:Mitochondrial ATP synthase-coupling factor 6 n=1 Tax=Pseudodiaptomus poplesia TaxID=213370 RepID=A0A0U2THM5_9MAXI|nr:mitochondrial ATP synthase-coupling factor 6 [Pseudodiaptomus poplesia]
MSVSLFQAVRLSTRNFSVWAPALTKASDPIQALFVEKIREYDTKKKAAGGKLVDADANSEAALQNELDKVAKQYGGGPGVDMTSFPSLSFKDPVVEPINIAQ